MFQTCRENQNTHFMLSTFFLKILLFCEITWKNIVELYRPQMTMWLRCIACWIPMAIDTCSGSVILNGFPQQQWLHEHASILCCMYIACLLVCCVCGSMVTDKHRSQWLAEEFDGDIMECDS